MGCGASQDRVTKDPQIQAESAQVAQNVENLEEQQGQDQVIKMGNNNRNLDDYKKSPLTFKNQRGNARNNQIRNPSQKRGNNQGNSCSAIEDIEEMTLNETTNQGKTNQQANNNLQNSESINFGNNIQKHYSPTPEKASSKPQLNGFYLGNGQMNRRSNQKGLRSREGSLSSESRNDLSNLQMSMDANLNVNRTSNTQISNNLINIQDQQQNQQKSLNLFQMKKTSQYQGVNATSIASKQILEVDPDKIEDLSVHMLENTNNQSKYEKNTCTTIDMDTIEYQNDPLFVVTEIKPPLQKTQDYIEFSLTTPPILGHLIYKPDIDYTKENKQHSFNKDGIFNSSQSKKAQIIDKETAEGVRNLLFGNQQNKYLPKSWTQGFILNEKDIYGLIQKEGGPCGIIAVVQAYFIKYLLLVQKGDEQHIKKKIVQENSLLAALAEILYKCRASQNNNSNQIKLLISKQSNISTYKACDIADCQVITISPTKLEDVFTALKQVKEEFIGNYNNGIVNFLYSIIATKGVQNIVNAMDMQYSSLIGHHGHATQELVNLLLTGESRSNCFDGTKELGTMKLFGIKKRQQIGFLSALECDSLMEVGSNYKNSYLPIWVICKENHYTTLFARDCRIIENSLWNKFDVMWYDQLSEEGNYCHKITIEKEIQFRNNKFKRENDAMQILNKHSSNVLNTKWGSDISINWNGKGALL